MTSLQDILRRLLSQYTFEVDSNTINENLTCIICKNIMIDAFQSSCGCHYCYQCIVDYLSKGDKYCCGGKDECSEEYLVLNENVNKSSMLNKQILKIKVICPNPSCTHSTELLHMEKHLHTCNIQSISCPYASIGCDNERTQKSKILTHLNDSTLSHTQLLIEWIHNLKNEVDILKTKFETSQSDIDILMEDSILKDDQKRISDLLKKESKDKDRKITENTVEIMTLKYANSSMREDLTNNENTMDKLKTKLKKYRRDTGLQLSATEPIPYKRMKSEKVTCEEINKLETTYPIGEIKFTVNRFEARKASMNEIYSSYFYSHENGYKLRLQVNPGGNGSGSGTHLSVFVVISSGEYDDILSWPCKYCFNISIINQFDDNCHYTVQFSYDSISDNYKHSFNKAIDGDNKGYGYSQFLSHDDLSSVDGLLLDDSIIIKCKLSPPTDNDH